jgi:BlaI family penicillinase repressor
MVRPKVSGLTDNELLIMKILWEESPLSVAEVLERLPREPKPAYTSLLTNIRAMAEKGYLIADRCEGEKAFLYRPVLKRSEYSRSAVTRLVEGLFDGRAAELAINLIKSEKISEEERKKIRSLLETL